MKKFFIVFFVLLIACCSVLGLGLFGIIKIPGLRSIYTQKPAKKAPLPPVDPNLKVVSKAPPPEKKTGAFGGAPPKPIKPPVQSDPDKGAESLAEVWNEVDTAKLIPIIANWKDADLAKVLSKMDQDKVADVLSQLKPDRASKVSQIMQKEASVVSSGEES